MITLFEVIVIILVIIIFLNFGNFIIIFLNFGNFNIFDYVACLGLGAGERGAGLTVLSRGFSFVWLVARALPRHSLFGRTLRERRGFPFHAPRVRLLQEF